MQEFWRFLFALICAIEGEEIEERPRSPPFPPLP